MLWWDTWMVIGNWLFWQNYVANGQKYDVYCRIIKSGMDFFVKGMLIKEMREYHKSFFFFLGRGRVFRLFISVYFMNFSLQSIRAIQIIMFMFIFPAFWQETPKHESLQCGPHKNVSVVKLPIVDGTDPYNPKLDASLRIKSFFLAPQLSTIRHPFQFR